jgi:hypothetical protein
MTHVDPFSDDAMPVSSADVADSCSAACWSVEERAWKQDLPDLPDDIIALLAPPVVVTASASIPSRPPQRPPNRGTRPSQSRRARRLVDTVEP